MAVSASVMVGVLLQPQASSRPDSAEKCNNKEQSFGVIEVGNETQEERRLGVSWLRRERSVFHSPF